MIYSVIQRNQFTLYNCNLPTVLTPISRMEIPSHISPCILRRRTRNACGPLALPLTVKLAITTAQLPVYPCEIQFFAAPLVGVLIVKVFVSEFQIAVVCTTSPEFTPANFSVNPKQPGKL